MRTVVDFSRQVWKLEDSESNEWGKKSMGLYT